MLDSSDVKLNPSRVVVSLANVERLKKMMNNSERTQEVLARIEDTLKRQRIDGEWAQKGLQRFIRSLGNVENLWILKITRKSVRVENFNGILSTPD